MNKEHRSKLARFCNVDADAVVESQDAESIYEVPLLMQEEGLDALVVKRLDMVNDFGSKVSKSVGMEGWVAFVKSLKAPAASIRIALVGKYVEHQDAYKSICESFIMAGAKKGVLVDLKMVLSDDVTSDNVASYLEDVSGILVAPGFGDRGIEGKIESVRYAREKDIPFLGICLGMQCAVIEYARNKCSMDGANSTEFDLDTPYPVIDLMNDQRSIERKGGTMRLGAYDCEIVPGTKAAAIYDTGLVSERHRHRFELNNDLKDNLSSNGMIFSGRNPDKDLIEIIELPEHRWFIGVQFHPEYKTTVGNAHPLFDAFVDASTEFARETGALTEPRPKTRQNIKLATAKL